LNYKKLSQKLNDLEKKYDSQFKEVFDILKNMLVIDRKHQEQKILRKGLKD
jgi:hypothetical protein